uniref:Uncharacterized protein n=1 Tax=Anguilla anguilla TaxID=7936 RepID=A0A0E9XA12_ANGAN
MSSATPPHPLSYGSAHLLTL